MKSFEISLKYTDPKSTETIEKFVELDTVMFVFDNHEKDLTSITVTPTTKAQFELVYELDMKVFKETK